jgi:hypothetical protein
VHGVISQEEYTNEMPLLQGGAHGTYVEALVTLPLQPAPLEVDIRFFANLYCW